MVSNIASVKLHLKITNTSILFESFVNRYLKHLYNERSLHRYYTVNHLSSNHQSNTKIKKMTVVYYMLYLYIRLNTRKQIMMSHYATSKSYKTYNCFPAFHFGTFCHLYFLHISQSQTNRALNLKFGM